MNPLGGLWKGAWRGVYTCDKFLAVADVTDFRPDLENPDTQGLSPDIHLGEYSLYRELSRRMWSQIKLLWSNRKHTDQQSVYPVLGETGELVPAGWTWRWHFTSSGLKSLTPSLAQRSCWENKIHCARALCKIGLTDQQRQKVKAPSQLS